WANGSAQPTTALYDGCQMLPDEDPDKRRLDMKGGFVFRRVAAGDGSVCFWIAARRQNGQPPVAVKAGERASGRLASIPDRRHLSFLRRRRTRCCMKRMSKT